MRLVLAIPGEHRSVDQVVLGFVSVKDREVAISKSLLCRCNRRVVEC